MAGSCECGDEPSGSGATKLVSKNGDCSSLTTILYKSLTVYLFYAFNLLYSDIFLYVTTFKLHYTSNKNQCDHPLRVVFV
jgi:hypothetical protein